MSEKVKVFCVALRAIALEFVAAVEELLDYPREKRTSHLLRQARRAA